MFRGFCKLVVTEFKLFLREPMALFFTFIFPLFFMFLTMEVFIGDPVITYVEGGQTIVIRVINYVLPNIMLMIIATTAFMSLPLGAIEYREIRFFKRLKASPVEAYTVIAALGTSYFAITTVGIFLLSIFAVIFYQAEIATSVLLFFLGYLLSFLAIAAIGFGLIGSVCRTTRSAMAVGQILYFPAMFFSGVFVPLEQLPEWLKPISDFIPITYASRLMQGMWQGEPVADFSLEIIILLAVSIVGAAVAAKNFRWE